MIDESSDSVSVRDVIENIAINIIHLRKPSHSQFGL